MTPEDIQKAKAEAVKLVSALKKAESGKKLTAEDQASIDRATTLRTPKLSAPLDAWAVALGRERRTLERIMVRNGFKIEPGKNYSASEVYTGLFGDDHAEKIRNMKLDADRKEREEAEAHQQLVSRTEMEKYLLEQWILPWTQRIMGAPSELAPQCNPTDPTLAHSAILTWVEEGKRILRTDIEKVKIPKTEKKK